MCKAFTQHDGVIFSQNLVCACAVCIRDCALFAGSYYTGRGKAFLGQTQWKQSPSKLIQAEPDGPSKLCQLPPKKQRW